MSVLQESDECIRIAGSNLPEAKVQTGCQPYDEPYEEGGAMSIATDMVAVVEPDAGNRRCLLGIELVEKVSGQEDGIEGLVVLEAIVPPGVWVPLHTHGSHECFYVIEGTFEFGRMGANGVEVVAAPVGTMVRIPGGAVHSFRNIGATTGKMLVIAAEGLLPFFRDAGCPVQETPVTAGPPSEAEIGRVIGVMSAHGQELLGPHPSVQG